MWKAKCFLLRVRIPFSTIGRSATIWEQTANADVDAVINDEYYPNPYWENKMNSDVVKLQNSDKRKNFLNPKLMFCAITASL
jgi:hypothetical protein